MEHARTPLLDLALSSGSGLVEALLDDCPAFLLQTGEPSRCRRGGRDITASCATRFDLRRQGKQQEESRNND